MTVEPGWVPPDIDTSKANIARVYDYWLGGDHNFRADQDAARSLTALEPNPASVLNSRGDVVAYNAPYRFIISDIEQFPPDERNCIWLDFTAHHRQVHRHVLRSLSTPQTFLNQLWALSPTLLQAQPCMQPVHNVLEHASAWPPGQNGH